MPDINTVHQLVIMTGAEIKQNPVPQGRTPAPNAYSEFFTWPVLGILCALLLTVAWCGFLTWLLILLY
jgi:hypothetical protein